MPIIVLVCGLEAWVVVVTVVMVVVGVGVDRRPRLW